MIPRIKYLQPCENFTLHVIFDDGKDVIYDVKDDIKALPTYRPLMTEYGLFQNVQLDESRTCVYWSEDIDLPSDTIYEYGASF